MVSSLGHYLLHGSFSPGNFPEVHAGSWALIRGNFPEVHAGSGALIRWNFPEVHAGSWALISPYFSELGDEGEDLTLHGDLFKVEPLKEVGQEVSLMHQV